MGNHAPTNAPNVTAAQAAGTGSGPAQEAAQSTRRLNTAMSDLDRLAQALLYAETAPATDLYARMNRCRFPTRCGLAACPPCRRRYIGSQQKAARSKLAGHGNADLGFLSLVVGATTEVLEVEGMFRGAKKVLKNLIEAQRRQRKRWNALQALLWLEVDAVAAEDIDKLPPDKRQQYGEFGINCADPSRPVWIVTVHGIIAHPGIEIQEVRMELEDRWSKSRQVKLKAFYSHQTPEQNIDGVIGYSLKHLLRIHFGWSDGHRVEETWPAAWSAEYYTDLFSWTHGFKSQRMSLSAYDPDHPNSKARRERRAHCETYTLDNDSCDSEYSGDNIFDYFDVMPISV